MIKSYRSKALRRFAEKGDTSKLPLPKMADKVGRILSALNVAKHPLELAVPGFDYHALTGPMKGRHSIWVSGNWRITFGWEGEDATDVDMEDYHGKKGGR